MAPPPAAALPVRRFFKVFFPELYSHRLEICRGFRKHVKGGIFLRGVSLMGPSGSVWEVELAEVGGRLFFCDGWGDFARDHSLQTGEFLVFEYNGGSVFNVIVLDHSACEKKAAFLASPARGIPSLEMNTYTGGIEEEEGEVVAVEDDVGGRKPRNGREIVQVLSIKDEEMELGTLWKKDSVSSKQRSKRKDCKKQSGRHGIVKKCKIQGHRGREKGKEAEDDVGGPDPCYDLKTVQPLSIKEEIPETWFEDSVSSKQNIVKKCKIQCPRMRLHKKIIKSQRRPVQDEEIERARTDASSFKSDHPFFMVIMRKYSVYTGSILSIPVGFARAHLPTSTNGIILQNPEGQTWTITGIPSGHSYFFSAGWRIFCVANHLEEYDACVFELVEKGVMRVHIFRVVEELTPMIPSTV